MNDQQTYQTLDGLRQSGSIIFNCVAGSVSYGTNTADSDIDERGLFILPSVLHRSIFHPVAEVASEKQDTKFYELKKFISLAAECNPNIIELLWSPQDCIKFTTPVANRLIENRRLFISKKALHTFSGYAFSQISKAKGQNKMIVNPAPEEKPKKEDFCWYIQRGDNADDSLKRLPSRPVLLKDLAESGCWIDLSKYNAAALEHTIHVYRLYYYGDKAKGVFRGDDSLTCESIPIDEEWDNFMGLLIYNQDAFNSALRDWNRYWDWHKNRNEARWKDKNGNNFDCDWKNIHHCVRLLLSGENILTNGEPIVRFEGEQLQYLKDIRAGKFEYSKIMPEIEAKMENLKAIAEKSSLPWGSDSKKINELYLSLVDEWESSLNFPSPLK